MSQDPYAHEKGVPAVPQCGRSPLSLRFDGMMLALRDRHKQYSWPAVSGRSDARGSFDNSAARQRQKGEGPIPADFYWIDPAELWERNGWNVFQQFRVPRVSWGDYRITIHVQPGTETHGRGGFFIHGGGTPGSAGCIDLTVNMDAFVRTLREQLNGNTSCYIGLLVQYS